MDLNEELRALLELFEKHAVDYALCGGIAVTIHGFVRSTKDIDVLVKKDDLERVTELVRERGFTASSGKLSFEAGKLKEREVHRILKIAGREILVLDLIVVTPVLEPVWATREIYEWRGRRIKVVSRSGLQTMKLLAGRRIDLADLENLGLLDTPNDRAPP